MRQKSRAVREPAEQVIKYIRRATRRHFSAEDKIHIVLDGLGGEDSIAELCRRDNTGEWDDSPAELDPGSGEPPKNDGPFSQVNAQALMQMMVLLADTDGDGALSLPEIQTVHERAFKQIDANGDGKATRAEIKLFFEMDGPARR